MSTQKEEDLEPQASPLIVIGYSSGKEGLGFYTIRAIPIHIPTRLAPQIFRAFEYSSNDIRTGLSTATSLWSRMADPWPQP